MDNEQRDIWPETHTIGGVQFQLWPTDNPKRISFDFTITGNKEYEDRAMIPLGVWQKKTALDFIKSLSKCTKHSTCL